MTREPSDHAAYHGRNWKNRCGSMPEDIRRGEIWADFACDSEWSRLRHVVLYRPGPEIAEIDDPDAGLHLRRLDHERLAEQHGALVGAFHNCGVGVHHVDRGAVDDREHPNLMFQRDTFWQTPYGAVIARMAHPVRAGEEKYTAAALAALHVPIALTVGGSGTFEGADCLWVGPRKVLCGVGVRTNQEGCAQVRAFLERCGIECLPVAVPRHVQHLLGCVQIVSPERAFVRTGVVEPSLPGVLRECGFEVVSVPEAPEVVEALAFNFLVLDRDKVLMADDAPRFCDFLEGHGIEVAARVPLSEYAAAAGGLACATGILARQPAYPASD